MTDYGYLFSTMLHKELKVKIRAGIFVKSTSSDTLEITIVRKKEGGLEFNMTIGDFATKMLNGYSVKLAAHEVMEAYKKFIMKAYFK